jgi:hypothetical protein
MKSKDEIDQKKKIDGMSSVSPVMPVAGWLFSVLFWQDHTLWLIHVLCLRLGCRSRLVSWRLR